MDQQTTSGRPGLDAYGTNRASRLRSGRELLVHADLHNHTQLSDGVGAPERAFASLRDAGLDVAAITDHAVFAAGVDDLLDLPWVRRISGIDQTAWRRLRELADGANQEGAFVALRGFEWSHPLLGHVNVWDSERYTDPFRTFDTDLSRLYDWLADPAGGADGLAGFNHPGGRGNLLVFAGFEHVPAVSDQLVGLEVFNKKADYLFEGTDAGGTSPLVSCLDRGWRPGLLGVSDEHGNDWGRPEGKGRTGLYVDELSRHGVRRALSARQAFATRERGLRVDATLAGRPMGTAVRLPGPGPSRLSVELDVDRGEAWWGRRLSVQLLRPGQPMPTLVGVTEITVPRPDQPLPAWEVALDPADGAWAVLRISDPATTADQRAEGSWVELGASVAYASPWWLETP